MTELRSNKTAEIAVSKGIAAISSNGVLVGIKIMREEQIPLDVIYRVILIPDRRRATDLPR